MPLLPWVIGAVAGAFVLDRGAKFLDEANETTKLAMIGGAAFIVYRTLSK